MHGLSVEAQNAAIALFLAQSFAPIQIVGCLGLFITTEQYYASRPQDLLLQRTAHQMTNNTIAMDNLVATEPKQNEQRTPVSPLTNNQTTSILKHINNCIAFLCATQITILYMTAADNFFSHFYHSNQTLNDFKHDWMQDNITVFSQPWHKIAFGTLIIPASIALFTTNLISMPDRLHQLFTGEQKNTSSENQNLTIKILSIISGTWKMVVSGGDLFLLLQTLFSNMNNTANFWLSLSITTAMSPGDIMAQLYNFMGKHSICHCNNNYLRNILSGYFALGYALGSMGLYGHTLNSSLRNAKLSDHLLTETNNLAPKILINGTHLFFNLIFAHQTITQYFPRFQSMLQKFNPFNEETSDLLQVNEPTTNNNDFQYNILNRFNFAGLGAACYKTLAIYFSQIVLSTALINFETLNPGKIIYLSFLAVLQIFSILLIQLTYYRLPSDNELRSVDANPTTIGVRTAFFCCASQDITATNQNNDAEQNKQHTIPSASPTMDV